MNQCVSIAVSNIWIQFWPAKDGRNQISFYCFTQSAQEKLQSSSPNEFPIIFHLYVCIERPTLNDFNDLINIFFSFNTAYKLCYLENFFAVLLLIHKKSLQPWIF